MSEKKGLPWWAWVPFFPVLLALLLLWRTRNPRRSTFPIDVHRDSIPLPMEPRMADDLTLIKGIGLKSASVLNAAGISTFAQLAAAPEAQLRDVLLSANLGLVNPTGWPQQARLFLK